MRTRQPAGRHNRIAGRPLQGDAPLAMGRAGHGLQRGGEELAQTHFAPVAARTAARPAARRRRDRLKGTRVVPETGNEVAALGEEPADDFAAGVVGIGDEQHRFGQAQ